MVTFRSLNELDVTKGTVTLIDGTLSLLVANLETRRLDLKEKSDGVVFIPQPSDDINDPLNWHAWKKFITFLPVVCFAALGNWVVAAPGSAVVLLMKQFQKDLSETSNGVITW